MLVLWFGVLVGDWGVRGSEHEGKDQGPGTNDMSIDGRRGACHTSVADCYNVIFHEAVKAEYRFHSASGSREWRRRSATSQLRRDLWICQLR